ncbi:autotransporter translocation and assembly factor TamB [Luteimonas cucumeris]|uniref:Autotransporter translocation and assembly factor TamB n=1 Tax=Luteimonas cucumeris TaxID=985012 RepID=A0A562KV92_9GAMM|nr:translocation/assembly module TamB domain-containing protein [Luteimonas cucumeris]TWH99113.1 autotransporter translocation and assembly factor TamB [Luteimonas cucumeris]
MNEAAPASVPRRRFYRRRRFWAWSGALIALGAVGLALLLYWLLQTVAGRDVLLAQIIARLPAGSSLTWDKAEGPLAGPLTLHGLDFRHGKLHFTAERAYLDPDIRPLLGRRLRLDALQITNATLEMPKSDDPFELPRWPQSLPQIEMPLAIQADTIVIDGLRVSQAGEPVIGISSLRGGIDIATRELHARQLVVDSDRGRFTIHGHYIPREEYRTDLKIDATFPQHPGRTPARLALHASGDLSKMAVTVTGNAPAPLRASLTLAGKDAPTWSFTAKSEALDLALLMPPVDAALTVEPSPLALDLRASGQGGNARLQGSVVQGGRTFAIEPSNVRLENQVLGFAPLALRAFDGRIVLRGTADLRKPEDAPLKFTLEARGLRFEPAADPAQTDDATPPQPVEVDADFDVGGRLTAWTANGNATLRRGDEQAKLVLDASGGRERAQLKKLQATMPTGTLDASGKVAWAPLLDWDLQATLAGFDPGYFAPGWEGSVNGKLQTQGRQRPAAADGTTGGFDATIDVADLGGRLRERALSGRGKITLAGQRGEGDVTLALGNGRVEARGGFGWSPVLDWNLRATFANFDPGLVASGWDGSVSGRVVTQGRQRVTGVGQPRRFDATADVTDLRGRLRGRALSGRGRFALRGEQGEGNVALTIGNSRIDARGSVGDRIDIDANLQPLQLDDLLPDTAGTLRGNVRLRGPRATPGITIDLAGSGLKWNDWQAETLSAKGQLPWRGGGGSLAVQGSAVQAGLLLDTLRLQLDGAVEDLRFNGDAGNAMGSLALSGNVRRSGARWQGAVQTLRLTTAKGAPWNLQQPAQFTVNGPAWTLSEACLGASGGGRLCAQAAWPQQGLTVRGDALSLALLQPWLPPNEGRPLLLRGEVTLDGTIRPRGNAWEGRLHVASLDGGLKLGNNARGELIRYDNFTFDADFDPLRIQARLGVGFKGHGFVDARVTTGWDGFAPLNGDIYLNMSRLFWLELFSPDLVRPQGLVEGHVSLAGTRARPLIGGEATLSNFTGELPALGLTLSNGQAQLRALPDGSARISGSVSSGKGALTVDGGLSWFGQATPLQLNIRGENVLVSDTPSLMAVANPDLQFGIVDRTMQLRGEVTVPSANIDLERLDRGVATSPDVVVLDPIDPEQAPSSALDTELAVTLGDDVRLEGFGLSGRITGRIQVRARPGREMTATGGLDVSGKYKAYGQQLDITRGQLSWSNHIISDPRINIRAERRVGEVTAGIDVTGRAQAPRALVWSDPVMQQSQAISYLMLGRNLAGANSADALRVDAASAALAAGSGVIASQLGRRLGLDEAGVTESRALGGSVVGFGKHLTPKLWVGYGVSLVGAGQVFTLKYLLRLGFDIQIESSTVENRASINWRREK